ncbi:MAG: GAF domain-containing protein [Rhizobiaceae bacterium]|nr:GAF domain-containing protein [Rhizobiaceae bacterium]
MPKNPEDLLERYLAITRAIAGQMDFQSVLGEIAGELHHLFGHDHLDISILLPDQPDRNISFEIGMSTKWGQTSDTPHYNSQSPIRDILTGKVPQILTSDACNDARFHFEGAFNSPIFEANLRSRVHVPLQVHGEVHGSLNISSHQIGKYNQDHVEVAQQIADLLAPYFYALIWGEQAKTAALAEGAARGREEVMRLGALRLTEAMEDERKRIGMDLHDQTLADLTRILRRMTGLKRPPVSVTVAMSGIADDINTCINELRRIIEDTKPSVMDLFGFTQAIEAQLERTVEGITPPITTIVKDGTNSLVDDFPDSLRTALFRIVQEAINNAVKHSSPGQVAVNIEADTRNIFVSVCDDGSGMDTLQENYSSGLDNMRVRAAIISANLVFEPNEPGGGTRVLITIPRVQLAIDDDEGSSDNPSTEAAQ